KENIDLLEDENTELKYEIKTLKEDNNPPIVDNSQSSTISTQFSKFFNKDSQFLHNYDPMMISNASNYMSHIISSLNNNNNNNINNNNSKHQHDIDFIIKKCSDNNKLLIEIDVLKSEIETYKNKYN